MVPRSARGAYKARERERDSRYVEIADMSTSGKEVQRRFWTSQEVSRLPGLVRASVWLGSDLLQLLGAAISHLWRGEHYEKTRLCLGLEPGPGTLFILGIFDTMIVNVSVLTKLTRNAQSCPNHKHS